MVRYLSQTEDHAQLADQSAVKQGEANPLSLLRHNSQQIVKIMLYHTYVVQTLPRSLTMLAWPKTKHRSLNPPCVRWRTV